MEIDQKTQERANELKHQAEAIRKVVDEALIKRNENSSRVTQYYTPDEEAALAGARELIDEADTLAYQDDTLEAKTGEGESAPEDTLNAKHQGSKAVVYLSGHAFNDDIGEIIELIKSLGEVDNDYTIPFQGKFIMARPSDLTEIGEVFDRIDDLSVGLHMRIEPY